MFVFKKTKKNLLLFAVKRTSFFHNPFSLQNWAVEFEYPWKGDFCGEWVIRIVGAQRGVLGCRVRGGTTVNLVGTCSGVRGGLKSTLLEKRKVGGMG